MSRRNQDKRKARREEKSRQARKLRNARPVDRISGRDPIECWISENEGLDAIITFRRVAGNETVMTNFLIDYGCIGLKDAFFSVGMSRADMDHALNPPNAPGMSFESVPLAEVQRRVAAAMEWTRTHPFKLPVDAQMCAKLIGLREDLEGADVSEFGTEDGGMFYVGTKKDLVKRLQGITLEDLKALPDFDCDYFDPATGDIVDDEEDVFNEQEEEDIDVEAEIDAMQRTMGEQLIAEAKKWCFANGLAPEPALLEAVKLMLQGTLHAQGDPDLPPDDEANMESGTRSVAALVSAESEETQAAIGRAMEQLHGFMGQFKSKEELSASLGLTAEDADEGE